MSSLFLSQIEAQPLTCGAAGTVLDTKLEWDDLILPYSTCNRLDEIDLWIQHGDVLLDEWGMKRSIARGYKVLFYGPPGTGKTLAASLLGKRAAKKVFRVDLSKLVSKYIGETSKKLDEVFELAEREKWILFFDEADSLFARRTNVTSSNDRHANQETAHLLQRIEVCGNLVILASNLKDNVDEAFLRRFQSIVYFSKPGRKERLEIWKRSFSRKANVNQLDFISLSNDYLISTIRKPDKSVY